MLPLLLYYMYMLVINICTWVKILYVTNICKVINLAVCCQTYFNIKPCVI